MERKIKELFSNPKKKAFGPFHLKSEHKKKPELLIQAFRFIEIIINKSHLHCGILINLYTNLDNLDHHFEPIQQNDYMHQL